MKRLMQSLLLAALCTPLLAWAEFVEGTDYERLPEPVRTRDAAKVEVVELFWYGCPHCFHLEPYAKAWLAKPQADVDFWRSPAIFNPVWRLHAQAFYTAEALGIGEKVHAPMFEALAANPRGLANADEIAELFARFGVSRADFDDAWDSFGVGSALTQAEARQRSYRVTGTPTVIVNGKYRVTARSQDQVFAVVDYLVAKERATLKK